MASPEKQNANDPGRELDELRGRHAAAMQYIRRKVDQLLTVMGTSPLRPEELDDNTLIELDPISIISDSFVQILQHLKETNEQLKAAHDEITAIFDSAGMGILVVDRDLRVIAFNRKITEQFGVSAENAAGMICRDLLCKQSSLADCPALKAIASGASERCERDLSGRHFDMVATPIRDKAGAVARIVLVYMDMTERIRAQEELRRSEERYRDLFENSTDLIQILGADGSIVYVNNAWESVLGYGPGDRAGMSIFDIIHPDCTECGPEFKSVVCGHKGGRFETMFITKTKETVLVEGSVSPMFEQGAFVGTRGIYRDITERKKLEDRLIKSEKIESLGVLAGGIAHDFNNLLNSVIANVDIGMRFSAPDSEVHKSLVRAQKASTKAKELTQQLLTFSKGGAPVKKLASIADLIRDTADFGTRGANVRCEYELPPDLWNAEIDEGQISQVIQNLVINAVEAMPQGGTLALRGRNRVIGRGSASPLPAGNYVAITVRDTGAGIARENLGRIFDPYFTTKAAGSGLGLATTYSIIAKHNGAIDVESEEGQGTTFSVYLPASLAEMARDERPPAPVAAQALAQGRILVMDDDALVRETVGVLLDLLGYRSEYASDGDAALELYRRARDAGDPFAAVIMDLTIPGGKGGKATIGTLLRIDPAAKVIVSSGYSTDAVMADYAKYGFSGIVVKPYTIDELGVELERVLGKK